MRIFFTGASSFTGFWFAQTLVEQGHDVTATFTRESAEAYPEAAHSRARVEKIAPKVQAVWTAPMGSDACLETFRAGRPWDVVCLHGAQVGDHKRPDFPVLEALAANTHGLEALLAAAAEQATTPPILATGSYFEQDEAAGPPNRPAFSPYALSKGLTWQYYRYFAARAGIRLAKFIVANPFGPWEKGGFTSFLARSWLNGETPLVKTPDYIRDNVPVNLMAACYAWQAEQLATGQGPDHLAPSCYAGTQGDFGYRFAKEMGTRLGVPCQLETQPQTDYSEPQIRLNTDPAKTLIPSWSETNFWDELAEWYHEANR